MVRRLSERQQAVLFAAILLAAIAGVYAMTEVLQPAPVQARLVGFATLDVRGASWSIRYAPAATTNNTAYGILSEASARLGFSLDHVTFQIPEGVFVTAINGSVNGEGGRYWQYWVNGVYGDVAADHKALNDGDVVLWSFSASQEGM